MAEVVELQAKNERGMDRLEAGLDRLEVGLDRLGAQAAADRERAKADLEGFREALRSDTEAFKAQSTRANESFRSEVRAWIRESRQLTDTMAKQWGDLANRLGTVLPVIADFFPQAAGKELVPIFASFRFAEGVATYLTRHGVYCMVTRGDIMRLSNFDEVRTAKTGRSRTRTE
jgi:hypothetical protein